MQLNVRSDVHILQLDAAFQHALELPQNGSEDLTFLINDAIGPDDVLLELRLSKRTLPRTGQHRTCPGQDPFRLAAKPGLQRAVQ